MKSCLHSLEIRNFKAFREPFTLDLEGRHLLVYGSNGSGKSSLYWALYTFLQSSWKEPKGCIAKYFDAAGSENLLNTHEQSAASPRPGEIAVTIKNGDTHQEVRYPISKDDHSTHADPVVRKGDLASDFITYRFFFGFSDFRNSQKFNVWPLFEKEILPFCVSTGGQVPLEMWRRIKDGEPNPKRHSSYAGANAYSSFISNTAAFAAVLPGIVDAISVEAQKFYDAHFAADDVAKITFKLGVTTKPEATGTNKQEFEFTIPEIEFGIQKDGTTITRPQSHLNEAKMTQLALSIRFAASLVNLHDSDLKLLVLDDLLVSLDMSNRMKVVEILLTDPAFANYQKVILTHDRGFFEEFRRMIGKNHESWCFRSLHGNPKDGIEAREEKDALQKASDYLNGHDLEAAAVQLRKAVEDTAQTFLKMATGKAPRPGEFHSLSAKLEKAKNILLSRLPLQMFENVCSKIPKAHRDKLIRMNDDDVDADAGLTADEKTLLKQQRDRLKQFMSHDAWKALDAINVLDAVIQMKDRVLNPAAHWAEAPLYNAEVKKALTLVERLEATLLK